MGTVFICGRTQNTVCLFRCLFYEFYRIKLNSSIIMNVPKNAAVDNSRPPPSTDEGAEKVCCRCHVRSSD